MSLPYLVCTLSCRILTASTPFRHDCAADELTAACVKLLVFANMTLILETHVRQKKGQPIADQNEHLSLCCGRIGSSLHDNVPLFANATLISQVALFSQQPAVRQLACKCDMIIWQM